MTLPPRCLSPDVHLDVTIDDLAGLAELDHDVVFARSPDGFAGSAA